MHLFCINLITILTLIRLTQSSILPSLINDNLSHHEPVGAPSAFHSVSSSPSSIISSSLSPSSHSESSSSSSFSPPLSPSSSPSSPSSTSSSSTSPSSPSTDVEISDIITSETLDSNQNDNNNNGDDRFRSLVNQESHEQKLVPPAKYDDNQHKLTRPSILLKMPKIYPSSTSDTFASSSAFPSQSNADESKGLDYATTLIKEALEGPMMHDSNGDASDYAESSSSSSHDFEGSVDGMGEGIVEDRKENGRISLESGLGTDEERKGLSESELGTPLDRDEVNAVQPSEDQLFNEVTKLIKYIREAVTHSDDKGFSPKSRNSRNRLTLQMDYLQNLLDEYRQKQGTLNLRHWVRGVSPPRLSVTSPIAVLRDALMEEIKRKKIQETQAKIAMNEKILKEVG